MTDVLEQHMFAAEENILYRLATEDVHRVGMIMPKTTRSLTMETEFEPTPTTARVIRPTRRTDHGTPIRHIPTWKKDGSEKTNSSDSYTHLEQYVNSIRMRQV